MILLNRVVSVERRHVGKRRLAQLLIVLATTLELLILVARRLRAFEAVYGVAVVGD